jgi:PAS domain S-box-containing protein
VAVVWLANGAATAFIVSAPRERAWILLGVVAAANFAANLAWGDSLGVSLAFVAANVLEIALAVVLTRRVAEAFADEPAAYLRVLLRGAAVPPLLGATLGSLALQVLGFASFQRVWVDWYVGSLLGSVVALSLGLALRARQGPERWSPLLAPRALAALAGSVGLAWLFFGHLPYPFLWCAAGLMLLAYTQPRTVVFASAALLVATLATVVGLGVFVPTQPRSAWNNAVLYVTALVTVLPALVTAVMVARQRAVSEVLSAVGSRSDAIVVFADMRGVIRWANRAREAYWGTPNERIVGRHWSDNVGEPRFTQSVRPMLERALAGQAVHAVSEVAYPAKGERIMDVRMEPACDEDGRQIGVISCATDITELESARRDLERKVAQLRSSNESLDQFVRIASHDLREPMNSIAQFVALIEERQAERMDDETTLYFRQVRDGAQRMKTMLDDVLQFVRLEADAPYPRELVDLDALMQEVRQTLNARLSSTDALLSVARLGTAWGWRGPLLLVLQNLVANALKFVPSGRRPEVRVGVQRVAGNVRVEVADNGIGIAPERIAELGTPFRRLHSRRKFDGTGLGLAICRRIAEQHGGSIEIESTPDVGSRFTLVLPERQTPRA